jgi:hypothetical protein
MPDVYLANSHSWVYERLVERPVFERRDISLVDSRSAADMIIYLQPARPDPDAPEPMRKFRLGERLRMFVYAQKTDPFPWAPGVYTGVTTRWASRGTVGGFYVAHHHRDGGLAEDIEDARAREPDLLWSFRGTLETHPVRARLPELDDERGLVENTQEWNDTIRWSWDSNQKKDGRLAFERYAASLGRSMFVLCPRGRSPSSIRVFEALQAGRCPVIISDDWLPPAYVDWDSCAIRLPQARSHEVPKLLRSREGEASELGRRAREVWERHFAPERQLETLISACMTIDDSAPLRAEVFCRAVSNPRSARRGLRQIRSRLMGRG